MKLHSVGTSKLKVEEPEEVEPDEKDGGGDDETDIGHLQQILITPAVNGWIIHGSYEMGDMTEVFESFGEDEGEMLTIESALAHMRYLTDE